MTFALAKLRLAFLWLAASLRSIRTMAIRNTKRKEDVEHSQSAHRGLLLIDTYDGHRLRRRTKRKAAGQPAGLSDALSIGSILNRCRSYIIFITLLLFWLMLCILRIILRHFAVCHHSSAAHRTPKPTTNNSVSNSDDNASKR